MQRFIKCFRREGAGTWMCLLAAELVLPQGRIQVNPGTRFTRGTRFMNVEIAALLDGEFERQQALG